MHKAPPQYIPPHGSMPCGELSCNLNKWMQKDIYEDVSCSYVNMRCIRVIKKNNLETTTWDEEYMELVEDVLGFLEGR